MHDAADTCGGRRRVPRDQRIRSYSACIKSISELRTTHQVDLPRVDRSPPRERKGHQLFRLADVRPLAEVVVVVDLNFAQNLAVHVQRCLER